MIGVFGGTFDPVHYGHLRPALEVKQALGLEQLRLIPLAVAVHRDQPHASAEQRLAMLRAATKDEAGFLVDEREIRRQDPSYTLDTLRELRGEFPHTPLCLLIGGDSFNNFLTWRRPLDILQLAHLVVMQRPGYHETNIPQLQALREERRCTTPEELRNTLFGKIFFQPVTQLDISATEIRRLIKSAYSARFLLPDAVLRLIGEQGIYR